MTAERRPIYARIGIVALNLLWPGVGLLRLARGRAAAGCMAAAVAGFAVPPVHHAVTRETDFIQWAAAIALTVVLSIGALLLSIWWSWRGSRTRETGRPWWARWYAVLAVGVPLWLVSAWFWPADQVYKTFYLPAESMAPTLVKNDRFVASMRGPGTLRRGDVIVIAIHDSVYVKRVAALPGDSIAMEEGVVILNGKPVSQTLVGKERVDGAPSQAPARRLREQFPGEAAPHEIYDLGYTQVDDMRPQRIPPGHVFVLGDNRDRSADSRVPREQDGVELLPIRDIQGRALFHSWGSSGRIGQPLDR